jgi:hypothetical protein
MLSRDLMRHEHDLALATEGTMLEPAFAGSPRVAASDLTL